MRNLWTYLKTYRKESVLSPLFKLLEASFELFIPLVVAAMIDRGVMGGDRGIILRMGAVLVALGIVGLAASVMGQYYAAKAAVGFSTAVRRALFQRIQSLPYEGLDQLGSDTLINRMTSDVNQVQTGVNLTLRLFLRSPFIVFGAMIMAFTLDARSALVFAAAIPLLSIVVFGILTASIPLYRKVQQSLDRVLGLTRENLTGARVIRAFGREDQESDAFAQRNQLLTQAQQFAQHISALMNPITYLILNGALIALLWTGAVRVDGGAITTGVLVALVNYLSQILIELIKLANLIITITRALASWGRVETVLNTPIQQDAPECTLGVPDAEAGVRFDCVSLRYPGAGGDALSGISFSALRGQTIGIIGGTGSGKSSLVNLIPRFYDATEGCVLVGGIDVRRYALSELREKVAVVPQKAELFLGTVRDNLRWGDEHATDDRLCEALKSAQAWDFVEDMGGLDAPIAQRGKNLSGGQRQRLTVARALVRQAELLILDDSASALDFQTDAALRAALRGLKWRPTVFIVSQRTSSLQAADQIVVLDEGAMVGLGAHDALLKDCEVYRGIYRSQFPKEAT